jgi:hypothetical protein
MVMKSTVFSQTIRKNGYFNFGDLYSFCVDWFKGEGYDVIETDYVEKGSGAKEVAVNWAPQKDITDYFRFVLNTEIFILDLKDAEIERDGNKEKTHKGNLRIRIRAEIHKDYEERWEQKPMSKFMRGVYEQYIIKTTIDEFETRLIKDASNFAKELKSFMELAS